MRHVVKFWKLNITKRLDWEYTVSPGAVIINGTEVICWLPECVASFIREVRDDSCNYRFFIDEDGDLSYEVEV